jgi:uncharacterized membrane protein
MKPSALFTKEQQKQITDAIRKAELNTSGEIRVHIESKCKIDVLDRAAMLFSSLNMHKTELRNGVLFYLATDNKKFAILGDAGINQKVPDNFWETIKISMLEHFQVGDFATGLEKGILMAGEQLKQHFAYQTNDVNELSDEISFGK